MYTVTTIYTSFALRFFYFFGFQYASNPIQSVLALYNSNFSLTKPVLIVKAWNKILMTLCLYNVLEGRLLAVYQDGYIDLGLGNLFTYYRKTRPILEGHLQHYMGATDPNCNTNVLWGGA